MPLFGNLISMGAGGGVVVNAGGADIDTRIEGDTDTNALVIDASTDSVGIGTATPCLTARLQNGREISHRRG